MVKKLVVQRRTIEPNQADSQLVEPVLSRFLKQGFLPSVEILDNISINQPKTFDLMAITVKDTNLNKDAQSRIAQKIVTQILDIVLTSNTVPCTLLSLLISHLYSRHHSRSFLVFLILLSLYPAFELFCICPLTPFTRVFIYIYPLFSCLYFLHLPSHGCILPAGLL